MRTLILLLAIAAVLPGQARREDPPAYKESGMPFVVTGLGGAI